MAPKKCTFLILLFVILFAIGVYLLTHHHVKPHKLATAPAPAPGKTQPHAPDSGNTKSHSPKLGTKIKFNVTVSAIGDEKFTTISEAILSAPSYSSSKYFIRVRSGVYNETVIVPRNKTNVVLVGDGAEVTKITANRHHPDFSTSDSATFSVFGDGFMAQDITFENSAGSQGSQAVALLCNANHTIFYKCKFLGYQDTLYSKYGTQYYRECEIYGTVDFIFGSAMAVFQKCNLYARVLGMYQEVTYTAQGRQSLEEKSGFTMQGCNFTIEPNMDPLNVEHTMSAYLGRPWYPYSTVMVMESFLDKTISPSGWKSWSNTSQNHAIYLEFKNWGPGANTSKRVHWNGFKVLDDTKDTKDAISYTASQLIQGDEWIPETGVPYDGGFISKS